MTENEVFGQHHQLSGSEFEQTQCKMAKDRETWPDAVHGIAKSQTQLSNRTTTNPR